jgi:hypothetical protein
MELERKQFTASVQAADEYRITALVSVFNVVDHANERVMPGAFKASLARRMPKGVWAHDWQTPVAKTLEAHETDKGLVIDAVFNPDTQRGREAFSDIKFGIIDEFSIGYRVVKDSFDGESKDIRQLDELELYEWSPVLVGMNPATELLTIKSDVPSTYANQAETALDCVTRFATRSKSLYELCAAKGRDISLPNQDRFIAFDDALQICAVETRKLRQLIRPPEKASDAEARAVYAEFLKTLVVNK